MYGSITVAPQCGFVDQRHLQMEEKARIYLISSFCSIFKKFSWLMCKIPNNF